MPEGETTPWMVWMVLCRREGVNTDIAKRMNSGLSSAVTGGLYGHFLVADFDAHRLGRYGVNVGAHELSTPSELLGGLRCPAVIVNQKWSGQSQIGGGAASWTAVELDGQMTFISAHLPHKGKKLGELEAVLMDIQEFVSGRPKQHVILGGDFNASLYGMTDFFHVRESIPRPRTLVDTNDSLRARALDLMVTTRG